MIWPAEISFEGYARKKAAWFDRPEHMLGDPPITAQYALDLIFKTLIDDNEHLEFLATMPESTEQTNSVMLELILRKYSKNYRRYLRSFGGRRKKQ